MTDDALAPPRAQLLALATVYVVWGSTYLAIAYAVETLPPFLMGGIRFLISGSVLVAWARLRGAPAPRAAEWRAAASVGALLLLLGNGGVIWGEELGVPSGIAALVVAIVPLWMVVLEWARPGGQRPTGRVLLGLALGLAGLVYLVGPGAFAGADTGAGRGAAIIATGSFCWALGSIWSRHAGLPRAPLLSTGMQMLAGGSLMLAAAAALGELHGFAPAAVSARSWLGLAYLVTFGSLLGFTAYTWLLQHAPPARTATYAYVNPVVAVLLGWATRGEPLTARVLVAAAVIVTGVVVIVSGRRT